MKISIFDKGSNNIKYRGKSISIHINKFKHINTKNLNGFYCHFLTNLDYKKRKFENILRYPIHSKF